MENSVVVPQKIKKETFVVQQPHLWAYSQTPPLRARSLGQGCPPVFLASPFTQPKEKQPKCPSRDEPTDTMGHTHHRVSLSRGK